MNIRNNKLDMVLIAITVVLFALFVRLFGFKEVLSRDIIKQQETLVVLAQKKATTETEIQDQKQQILTTQERLTKELTGFVPSDLKNDEKIILDYLENIFVWENGDQYDRQREVVRNVQAEGTEELLKTVMTANYRVSVPDNLKGKIKDNDIDINGLKSTIVEAQINRMSWDKTSTAQVAYIGRVQYQIYINEADLSGEHRTVGDLFFTFQLSGIGKERKVTAVKYAYIG